MRALSERFANQRGNAEAKKEPAKEEKDSAKN